MSAYELEILLWYYARTIDHPDIARNPPIWRPTIEQFLGSHLLKHDSTSGKCYALGERGEVYVDALLAVPLPAQKWVMEWPKESEVPS